MHCFQGTALLHGHVSMHQPTPCHASMLHPNPRPRDHLCTTLTADLPVPLPRPLNKAVHSCHPCSRWQPALACVHPGRWLWWPVYSNQAVPPDVAAGQETSSEQPHPLPPRLTICRTSIWVTIFPLGQCAAMFLCSPPLLSLLSPSSHNLHQDYWHVESSSMPTDHMSVWLSCHAARTRMLSTQIVVQLLVCTLQTSSGLTATAESTLPPPHPSPHD